MVYTMASVVFDLIDAFSVDDFGSIIMGVCALGACIALFRVMRRGAGG